MLTEKLFGGCRRYYSRRRLPIVAPIFTWSRRLYPDIHQYQQLDLACYYAACWVDTMVKRLGTGLHYTLVPTDVQSSSCLLRRITRAMSHMPEGVMRKAKRHLGVPSTRSRIWSRTSVTSFCFSYFYPPSSRVEMWDSLIHARHRRQCTASLQTLVTNAVAPEKDHGQYRDACCEELTSQREKRSASHPCMRRRCGPTHSLLWLCRSKGLP